MTSDGLARALADASAWLLYAAPLGVAAGAHLWARRRANARGRLALEAAHAANLAEPPSLHPSINPNRCLGCASCVKACPEGDVLGLVGGKAALVDPSACIGHGACRDACPFDAITLVLGTENRGVEIPRLSRDFQTAVPGIFVAGELGGMGLIRNAVEQGRQAMEAIRTLPGMGRGDRLDVVIVGAGPAGFSASLAALQHGLRFVTLEQETLGGTVAHYPRGKIVMTAPCDLPLFGRIRLRETSKESLLTLWREVVRSTGLELRCQERVESVNRDGDGFEVKSARGVYRTRALLLAIGRRGTPMKLGVQGEERDKVVYRLVEAEQYAGSRVLVVGGGDSALEAAMSIAEQPGAEVTLCHRGPGFARAKPKNRTRAERLHAERRLRLLLDSRPLEIGSDAVRIATPGGAREVPNDAVIVCVGGVLPTEFLRSMGVETETKHGTPIY
jgi:thioredoxin reductase/ferredoxin